ncbi:glucosamine 6-phosphate N-acetyltransferase 1-like [Lolium perenne]|uniref:glucosamine 6-phosphate N-acetyltransferase 1-like n=1 Tax=Lolium perenne TaxID=4522 RepID=UPI0021EAD1EB|nr:glucosamine 6-phosphate N-acetyltransferase 1-like [Lolium perenne]XP_051188408.1 glucosamine 6-phosphate N-acetyltransferase 1-like [Lolium perenne]XP_051188409.1 glucosamine 6-phosphate N-acetyltransferase 1-like [Lolium perenne]XP_051188410.1 glucosamine 6-phosphate N-acetyltransferase 1-like [Lolium perenne]XP_051188411.1 glucosamine 6-phosphate N-acetyltransferase 1-like [Lolium perenne]XP_051188412.1 glucosamine 6-phosphate N-acetyltransferase 1-like [Lolium perenne]XP_051188413.1 gl
MEQPQADPVASEAVAGAGDDADAYRIRPLELGDISKGFCDLLAQLSPSAPLTEDAYRTRFAELARLGADHLVLVAEHAATGRLAAAGAVLVERKFIRRCGTVGHVEDVVVDAAARGRGLGERVVRRLVEHARGRGCYKAILNCAPELKGFYAKVGFQEKNVQMGLYF